MGSNRRRLLSAIAVLVGVFVLAAAAFAGHQLENFPTDKADSPDLPEAAQNHPGPEDGGAGDGGGPTEDNHGQCVSTVAHSEEREALEEGWRSGLLMSLVAQDESMVGEDCDFSTHLEQTTAAEGPGASEESEGSAGTETSDQAKQDRKEFGQSKKAEHAPGS